MFYLKVVNVTNLYYSHRSLLPVFIIFHKVLTLLLLHFCVSLIMTN